MLGLPCIKRMINGPVNAPSLVTKPNHVLSNRPIDPHLISTPISKHDDCVLSSFSAALTTTTKFFSDASHTPKDETTSKKKRNMVTKKGELCSNIALGQASGIRSSPLKHHARMVTRKNIRLLGTDVDDQINISNIGLLHNLGLSKDEAFSTTLLNSLKDLAILKDLQQIIHLGHVIKIL